MNCPVVAWALVQTHLWDFGKSKRQAQKRGEVGLRFLEHGAKFGMPGFRCDRLYMADTGGCLRQMPALWNSSFYRPQAWLST